MSIFITGLILVALYFSALSFFRKRVLRNIFSQTKQIVIRLKNYSETDPNVAYKKGFIQDDIFEIILKESNPEELWLKLSSKHYLDKKKLGIAAGKITVLLKSIENLIELNRLGCSLVMTGGETIISDLEELAEHRKNYILIINQTSSDLKKLLD